MKKIIWLFLVLAVIALGIPAIDGYIFKDSFNQFLMTMTRDPRLKATVTDYSLGWFHSTAKVEIGLDGLPNIGKTPTLMLNVDITHGPLIYNRKLKSFMLAEAYVENKIPYPMAIQIFLDSKSRYLALGEAAFHFGGKIVSHVVIPTIKSTLPNGIALSWDGITLDYDLTPKDNGSVAINTNLLFGAMSIQSKNSELPIKLAMQPIQIDSTGLVDSNQIWLGNSTLNLPQLNFTNMEGKNTEIDQFQINFNTGTSNGLYALKYAIQLAKLDMPWNTILPMVAPLNASMSIKNLQTQYLMTFLHKLSDMRFDRKQLADENQRQPLIDMLMQKILTTNSELAFEGNMSTSAGTMEWNGRTDHIIATENGKKLDAEVHFTSKISEKLGLIIAGLYLQGEQKNQQAAMPETEQLQPGMNMFNEKVANLMKDGKLTLPVAMRVMDVKGKNLSVDQFGQAIKNADMSDAVRTDLMKSYAIAMGTPAAPAPTSLKQPQDLINGLVNDGYLTRDGEYLVVNWVREKGVMRVGTKVVE